MATLEETDLEAAMQKGERATDGWRYEIQHGPDGEANYAWLYRGNEMIATMKTHHAAALTAALAVQTQQGVEVKDWHRSDNAYGGVMFYSLREAGWRKGEPVMVNDVTVRIERAPRSDTDIEPIVQRIRSALVDVPAVESEPVGYVKPEFEQATAPRYIPAAERTDDWAKAVFTIPVYAHPPRSLSNEESEIDADLLARCKEIVEWKKTGKLPGEHLRRLGQSIADRLGGSLFIDNGLNQAELQTIDEALNFIITLSTRKGSAWDGSATEASGASPSPTDGGKNGG